MLQAYCITNKTIKTIFIIAAIIIFAKSYNFAQSMEVYEGKLKKELYSSEKLYGLYNIFFSKLNNEQVKYPPSWKDIEITELLGNGDFKKVYIIRYSDDNNKIKYTVDTDADFNFNNEVPLEFVKIKDLQAADIQIKVQKKSDSSYFQMVNYQIILAEKWTYRRIREYRYGEIKINNENVKIMLRSVSGFPMYDISDETELFLDFNLDGKINESWSLDSTGKAIASEKLSITNPFVFNGHKFEVVKLSPDGMHLSIKATAKDTAYAIGFKMPDFSGKDKEGVIHNLKEYKGKKILLELWSISCPSCERIRPAINSFINSYPKSNFVSLAIPRETSVDKINAYLKDHQYNSSILYVDDNTKKKLNPPNAFPMFILINPNGEICFQESGANYLPVIESLLR